MIKAHFDFNPPTSPTQRKHINIYNGRTLNGKTHQSSFKRGARQAPLAPPLGDRFLSPNAHSHLIDAEFCQCSASPTLSVYFIPPSAATKTMQCIGNGEMTLALVFRASAICCCHIVPTSVIAVLTRHPSLLQIHVSIKMLSNDLTLLANPIVKATVSAGNCCFACPFGSECLEGPESPSFFLCASNPGALKPIHGFEGGPGVRRYLLNQFCT